MGVGVSEFDIFAGLFVETLQGLGLPSEILDDVVFTVLPLRQIFSDGAHNCHLYNS